MSKQEKDPSIEIGYAEEKEETEIEYDKGITMKSFYFFLTIAIIAISIVSFNAYYSNKDNSETKKQLQIQVTSTGAKIEKLLNARTDNREQWAEMEAEQEKLNQSTQKVEEELAKYNISVIQ